MLYLQKVLLTHLKKCVFYIIYKLRLPCVSTLKDCVFYTLIRVFLLDGSVVITPGNVQALILELCIQHLQNHHLIYHINSIDSNIELIHKRI